MSKAELEIIRRLQELDVGYNIADKIYDFVVYSKQLFKEQCLLHFEDQKRTYRKKANRTKEDILEVIFRLSSGYAQFFLRFKRLSGSLGWAYLADSIAETGRLCSISSGNCSRQQTPLVYVVDP